MARLAGVDELLGRWAAGDEQAGRLAADALDQLDDLLAEVATVAASLHEHIEQLLQELPPSSAS